MTTSVRERLASRDCGGQPLPAHGSVTWARGTQAYTHLAVMAAGNGADLSQHLAESHGLTPLVTVHGSWNRAVEVHADQHDVRMEAK